MCIPGLSNHKLKKRNFCIQNQKKKSKFLFPKSEIDQNAIFLQTSTYYVNILAENALISFCLLIYTLKRCKDKGHLY